jgi:hypothetical protein
MTGRPPAVVETYDCFTSSYATLLACSGLDHRVLGEQFGYRRLHSERAAWPFASLRFWRDSFGELIKRWYGLEERIINHSGSDALWRHARSLLASGRPVIVSVDVWPLRHTAFHQIRHYPHRLLVVGHRADEAYVVDGMLGTSYSGWLPLTELLSAADSPEIGAGEWGFDARNTTIDLPLEPTSTGLSQEGPAAVLGCLRRYVADGGRRAAVDGFLADLEAVAKAPPDDVQDTIADGILFLGELASQRRLNADFLELAAEVAPVCLETAAGIFRQTTIEVDRMRRILYFGFRGRRSPTQLLGRLADRLRQISALEAAAIQEIKERLPE